MKPASLFLTVAILLVYLVELASGGQTVCETYGFVSAHASIQTAFSSMFLHDPTGWAHVLGNALFLLVFGTLVERELGTVRFLVLYVTAGLVGVGCHVLVDPSATNPMVGASGAIFGLMAACAMIHPKSLAFTAVFLLFNLIGLVSPELVGMRDVAIGVHIGGFVAGYAMTRVVFVGKLQEAA